MFVCLFVSDQLTQRINFGRDDLDEQQVIKLLAEVIETIKKENQELSAKQDHFQVTFTTAECVFSNKHHKSVFFLMKAQRDHLKMLLRQTAEERTSITSEEQSLKDENLQLKTSLEQEEKAFSILQEELRNLRSKVRDLEVAGAGVDSLLSENQRLKKQLEDEQQLIRDVHVQRDGVTAEARMLRKKLEKERKETEDLRRELSQLRSRVAEEGGGSEDLQAHLTELQKRLSFEQQRSDLWERLYVETKQENAKGDREPKVKKGKSMTGTVKETFDAVRNSTKEFVHHHKEQIKKAKEAVKENLRKFSDSVKSTFRHFKDSASTFIDKAQRFYNKGCDEKNAEGSWRHGAHRPHHRHKSDPFQSDTRKSGGKVHRDHPGAGVKGCSGVFDCAFQEFMSLFNTATEPIRADEFLRLLRGYLQQEVQDFSHWKELEAFVNNFFHDGVFIHDRMLFTDFLSGVEEYLSSMHEYQGHHHDLFTDLDDFVYRHLFGKTYTKRHEPR